MKELVTVVVPVYNVEKYLERCVDSIINQTYKKLEIILVDDGSTDSSSDLCDKLSKKDDRIKVIHKKNGGLSDARNVGIEIANGKYISFIDSDDYVESNFIEILYYNLVKYGVRISISDVCIRYDTGEVIANSTNLTYLEDVKELLRQMLIGQRDIENSACNKLYDISLFCDVRYPVGRLYEDTATTYKLLLQCDKIVVNSFPLYNYMKRRDSITQCKFNINKLQLIDAVEDMTKCIRQKYPDLTEESDRKLMWAYLSTLSQLASSSNYDRKIAKKLLSYVNKNRKTLLKNKNLSRRDKIGLISTKFGFKFYRVMWISYLKITKKY